MPKNPFTDVWQFLTATTGDYLRLGNWRYLILALFWTLLGLWAVTATVRHVLAPPWPGVVWSVLLVGGAVCAGFSPRGPSGPAFVAATGLFLLISAVDTSARWVGGVLAV